MNELKKEIQELEERRNLNLERVKLEIFEKVDTSINKRLEHIKPSPETLLKLQQLEEQNKLQNEKIDLMACQVNEMYAIFTSTNFVLKFTIKLFAGIGVITGAVIGCIELWKRAK